MPENQAASSTPAELVITRTVKAPRELVFKLWTEEEHLKRWWGPKGFSLEVAQFDLRPGGIFHFSMKSADGQEMWAKFVYREIAAPEKLVYVNSFSDPEGKTVRAPFSDAWPLEVLNTATFAEQDGATVITLRGGPINATAEEQRMFQSMFESMQQGFAGTFDQLDEYLASL
ncbi:SRPBCC domain-containing protein [Paenibacillus humicola]|uniref:SRPBCC domain-containing protein n=1 Tax=Paenibacillus humicola TaxID=3110540 RepID=UPI00237B288D|nr:SRPBCC domain-containing protein [Paenibacillus humicola]